MLTEAQTKLILLDKQKAIISKYYEELDETLRQVASEIGINGYFQSDEGIVYKVVKPNGRFVQYKDLDMVRTKVEGERAGTLSKKEAEEAGFKVGS